MIGSNPLSNVVLLNHLTSESHKLSVLFNDIPASQSACLAHLVEAINHGVELLTEWQEIVVEGNYLWPLVSLEHSQHLSNIEEVNQVSEVTEELADFGKVLDVFVFQSFVTEIGAGFSLGDELVQAIEVEIAVE